MNNKQKLFGVTTTSSGGHVVDRQQLLLSFEKPQSVMWMFCQKCGILLEMTMKGVRDLAHGSFELPPESTLSHFFIQSSCCAFCAKEEEGNLTVQLIKIIDVPMVH